MNLPIDQMLRDADRAWELRGKMSPDTLLGDLACHVRALAEQCERLARERDALAKTLDLLLSESAPQVVPCEDHPVLDVIYKAMAPESHFVRGSMVEDVTRESECVEFRDTTTGRRFEVIVRPIPDEEDRP